MPFGLFSYESQSPARHAQAMVGRPSRNRKRNRAARQARRRNR